VRDAAYKAKAYTLDGEKLFSPVIPKYLSTVTVSKVRSGDWFTPNSGISRFPAIASGHKIVDAVYKCALDVLYRCSSGEFIRNPGSGEKAGMWQAGFRTGEGYGVWVRDVVYVSILMGSLLDPVVARASIAYITANGIDNSEDGRGLPAVGVWDYFLATGDTSLIKQTYSNLKTKLNKIQYDSTEGLGKAIAASYLDLDYALQEENNGGYAFSTQLVYAEAYRAMALMGVIMGESKNTRAIWQQRSDTIKKNVRNKFWKASAGYYTEGRVGTKGYTNSYWENFGQSLAMWPRWGIADSVRTASVFNHNQIAFNEWGYVVRHFKPSGTYLGLDVWPFTEVGMAIAAARYNRVNDLNAVFFSTLRDAAMTKTFMECISWENGISWRYPGQLWHAMGFISMIFNAMLGMEYDLDGLYFKKACVPEVLKGLEIKNFKYRNAGFEIKTDGWGTLKEVLLDGVAVNKINTSLSGNHVITLKMSNSITPAQRRKSPYAVDAAHGITLSSGSNGIAIKLRGDFFSGASIRIFNLHGQLIADLTDQVYNGRVIFKAAKGSPASLLVSVCKGGRTETCRVSVVR
jgi:hypothetical protein